MFDEQLGRFDHIVAMDSLIHYAAADIVRVLRNFEPRATASILFTFAPMTPLLAVMHRVGKLFPKGDRAPAIQPVTARDLHRRLSDGAMAAAPARSERITSGFYISQAMELARR